jgi:hypothetical protein
VRFSREEQELNIPEPISLSEPGIDILVSPAWKKANEPIFVRPSGNDICFSDLQSKNVYFPIETSVSGRIILIISH